jgi:hypothetical protein
MILKEQSMFAMDVEDDLRGSQLFFDTQIVLAQRGDTLCLDFSFSTRDRKIVYYINTPTFGIKMLRNCSSCCRPKT